MLWQRSSLTECNILDEAKWRGPAVAVAISGSEVARFWDLNTGTNAVSVREALKRWAQQARADGVSPRGSDEGGECFAQRPAASNSRRRRKKCGGGPTCRKLSRCRQDAKYIARIFPSTALCVWPLD